MLDQVPTPIWSGADGGFTSPGLGGRRTWWFGDTVSVNGWLHNSTIVQTDGLMAPSPHTVIPADGNIIFWPAHAALLPDGRLLVPCAGLIPHATGWDAQPMRAAYVTRLPDGGVAFDSWAPWWPEGVAGGNAAQRYDSVVLHGGTLHTYARPADSETGTIKGVWHRQVPLASIGDESAWSAPTQVVPYETDGSWSPWRDAATGRWYSLAMSLDARTVLVYGANAGQGPWEQIAAHPSPWQPDGTPGEYFYVAHAHPWMQLLDEPGRLACTVSHTEAAGGRPHGYRPRFFSIPHPSASSALLRAASSGGLVSLGWDGDLVTVSSPTGGVSRLSWQHPEISHAAPEVGAVRITWTGE